jgi:hypothetical protein
MQLLLSSLYCISNVCVGVIKFVVRALFLSLDGVQTDANSACAHRLTRRALAPTRDIPRCFIGNRNCEKWWMSATVELLDHPQRSGSVHSPLRPAHLTYAVVHPDQTSPYNIDDITVPLLDLSVPPEHPSLEKEVSKPAVFDGTDIRQYGADFVHLTQEFHVKAVYRMWVNSSAAAILRSPSWNPSLAARAYAYLSDIARDIDFWANLFNLVSACGYVFADFARGYVQHHANVTRVMYIVLAFAVQFQANCYLFAWQGSDPAPHWQAKWAEWLNVLGSFGYVCTSFMYMYESNPSIELSVLLIEASCVLLFVVSALLYIYAWITDMPDHRNRGLTWRDTDMWANLFNAAAGLIYAVSSIAGLWVHFNPLTRIHAGTVSGQHVLVSVFGNSLGESEALRIVSKINVWGDACYVASAVAYYLSWIRDVLWDQPIVDIATAPTSAEVVKDLLLLYEPEWCLMDASLLTSTWETVVTEYVNTHVPTLGYLQERYVLDDVATGYQVFGCVCKRSCIKFRNTATPRATRHGEAGKHRRSLRKGPIFREPSMVTTIDR